MIRPGPVRERCLHARLGVWGGRPGGAAWVHCGGREPSWQEPAADKPKPPARGRRPGLGREWAQARAAFWRRLRQAARPARGPGTNRAVAGSGAAAPPPPPPVPLMVPEMASRWSCSWS